MSYSRQDGLNLDHLKWLEFGIEEGKIKNIEESEWQPVGAKHVHGTIYTCRDSGTGVSVCKAQTIHLLKNPTVQIKN